MLTLKQPRAPVVAKDEFERLFDRFLGMSRLFPQTGEGVTQWTPSLDFSETEKEYVVRVEAPGVVKDDFDVTVDGQLLTIAGRRAFEREEKDEEFFWREREEGRFVRTLMLPSLVMADAIEAKYLDGVLTIRLPKAVPAPNSRIPIR